MKKMLFISNISNKITNFSIPSIKTAQDLGYQFHMAANYSNFQDDETEYNVTLHHLDLKRNPLHISNIKAYFQLISLIKSEQFDVIHCNTPIGGVLGRLAGKTQKVKKIIYTAHGFHFYEGAPLISSSIFKFMEKKMALYTDAIITINQEDYISAKQLRLKKEGKVFYIPGVGIETSSFRKGKTKRSEILKEIEAKENSILLISIGELNSNKNHEVVIKALGKLQNLNVHYLVCGVGEEKTKLNTIVKSFNLEKNIHFLGYRTDVAELLKSADIYLLPSYREGLSRSMMEAMSSGLPCIASKIRGNVDLIEDNKGGILIKSNDVDGFAEAIINLASNDFLREKMGNYNSYEVNKYDIENVEKQMRKIYEEVLQNDKK